MVLSVASEMLESKENSWYLKSGEKNSFLAWNSLNHLKLELIILEKIFNLERKNGV